MPTVYSSIGRMCCAPRGTLFATIPSNYVSQEVHLWDPTDGTLKQRLEHPHPVTALAFSPDERNIFTACRNGTIYGWSTHNGELLGHFRQRRSVASLAHSDGRSPDLLAVGGDDGAIDFYPEPLTLLDGLPNESSPLTCCAISADGNCAAAGRVDGRLRFRSGERSVLLGPPPGTRPSADVDGRTPHPSRVFGIALSPTGTMPATVHSNERVIRIWDAASGEMTYEGDYRGVNRLWFDDGGRTLSGQRVDLADDPNYSEYGEVETWDVDTLPGFVEPVADRRLGRALWSGAPYSFQGETMMTVRMGDAASATLYFPEALEEIAFDRRYAFAGIAGSDLVLVHVAFGHERYAGPTE
jgi:WD40 repeat protein